jgi:hypothetical protein
MVSEVPQALQMIVMCYLQIEVKQFATNPPSMISKCIHLATEMNSK